MLDWVPSAPYTAEQLLEVLRILRDPENGCPWDKVQTHASIRKNFLEETCEVLEAIDADDPAMLREELGDVLMQVAFPQRYCLFPESLHHSLKRLPALPSPAGCPHQY